jgi:hypothetical protein
MDSSLQLRPTLLQSLRLLPILFLNNYGSMQCSWIIMEGFLTWCLILLSDCFVWWQVVWQLLQWVRVHTFSSVYCSWHCAFTSSHSTHTVFAHQLAVSYDRVWVPCSSLKRSWLYYGVLSSERLNCITVWICVCEKPACSCSWAVVQLKVKEPTVLCFC